jgi:beta-lactam-binding protein with PASTA domain
VNESVEIGVEEPAQETPAPPPPSPSERRRGPRFSFLTGTLLLAAVALLGGFLVMNLVLMPSFTRQGAEVQVPEVTGQSEVEAERVLASEGLKLSKISEQWSPDVPRGFVISQDPTAGGVVKRGRRISVIVSLGAQGTSVPILEGVTARQATLLLEGSGLRSGRIAKVYTDEASKDVVVASDPPGETLVEQGTVVNLLVSLGPRPQNYLLPDLTGKDAQEIARNLREEGFQVHLREGGPRQKSGLVSAQEPSPGHRISSRDSIVLFVHP